MPLPFSSVCDLLEQAHKLSSQRKSNVHVVVQWFARHRDRISAHDTGLPALLSTLLPEKRTDRVYCIQAPTLEKIIGRALLLGSSRIAELRVYKLPGQGVDLADCVARLLTATPSPACDPRFPVTVEEIDEILHSIASRVKWSSPSIRASQSTLTQSNRGLLEKAYQRLSAIEAKWFTRLILKDYKPLILEPQLVYRLCDPILPSVLKIRDDFTAAIEATQAARGRLLPNSTRNVSPDQFLATVKPQLGIKVGRQPWFKGRSIKHCLDMGHGRMSVEEKIDGEYCQIHVNPSKGDNCIQIFSKSGKDSTEDREALHGVIRNSLKINQPGAKVTSGCILEGELVVYHDLEQQVLPFHIIRRHVSRRGRFLHTEHDSLPGAHEHLMIIYYDILLLNNQSLINTRHSERFKILSDLIICRKGHAELVQRQVIDFGHRLGASHLRKVFAKAIVGRKEGLVLKSDDPYFNFRDNRRQFSGCCIKLKKEYIGNFGDVGDFAVVGARYDPTKAKTYKIPNLMWTHFYLGCLDNREEVKRWNAKPEFTVVSVVELNETMLRDVVCSANPMPVPANQNSHLALKLALGVQKNTPMSVVFANPLVFDLRCFSFDKEGNTGFWSLRFPSVTKVHFDRDFTDTVSFEELQALASDATTAPELEDSQENLEWIARLEGADPRGVAVDAVSQLTVTTMPTPSPRKSTQSTSQPWSSTWPTVLKASAEQLVSPIQQRTTVSQQLAPLAPQIPRLPPPLTTPPTSSAPAANRLSDENKLPFQKRKSPNAKDSLPNKRLRPEPSSVPRTPTQGRPNQNLSPSNREPLGSITGNSQTTMSSFSSAPPIEGEEKKTEVIDLTSSPEQSFVAAITSNERSSQIDPPGSSAEDTTTITIPPRSIGNLVERRTLLSRNIGHDVSIAIGQSENPSTNRTKIHCRYAEGKCHFAKSEILLLPDLLDCEEVQVLLDDHGVRDPVTDFEEWLYRDAEQSRKMPPSHSRSSVILLVDSIERPYGTKVALETFEEQRKALPGESREWVTVYDWRVLKYVSVMEDENITEKYYDGFKDPWRRWYCGIV